MHSSRAKQDTVRQLMGIPKILVAFPLGAHRKWHCDTSPESVAKLKNPSVGMVAAWASYGNLISQVENVACDLTASSVDDRSRHDRAQGPIHVTKNVMGNASQHEARSNPATRA